jgi:hypothetical protein
MTEPLQLVTATVIGTTGSRKRPKITTATAKPRATFAVRFMPVLLHGNPFCYTLLSEYLKWTLITQRLARTVYFHALGNLKL